ncbi:hypothetical protein BO94DRAFT_582487 [Aspergillus sclerotioniger CBS 115572]|uniref:Uncharacterized protein n=1 Tax=Aspergillus sclerotioniger CBS 115572 TaxID=1450535 RepID=A0A317X7B2_9EURO|nr:hypothetical protein BO94DRAFT_582487 [Aspergillus sclerotioniger CBS 115572]PWY94081.1 hypothetical protein BO94DRAFT_582487 [Aspergillus sclerotioniger CBS 115572]
MGASLSTEATVSPTEINLGPRRRDIRPGSSLGAQADDTEGRPSGHPAAVGVKPPNSGQKKKSRNGGRQGTQKCRLLGFPVLPYGPSLSPAPIGSACDPGPPRDHLITPSGKSYQTFASGNDTSRRLTLFLATVPVDALV